MTKKSWIAFVCQWKNASYFLQTVFDFLRSCINIFSGSYKRSLLPGTEKKDQKRRRSHRHRHKNEKLKAEIFEKWGGKPPLNHPRVPEAPESDTLFDFRTWPGLPNFNNSTEEKILSGSKELTVVKHSASADTLSSEEEFDFWQPPHKKDSTGEDTVSRFQDLTISSARHVSVKYSTTADSSPAEEFLPPSDTQENTKKYAITSLLTASYAPNISVEQYTIADTLPAEGNLPLPYIKKYTGKEREIGSPCSQILIETSVPKVPVKHSASADVPPAEEDIGTMESNRTERKRIDLSSFNAQNSSNTKEATANLKMKAPAKIVSRAETVHHNNRRSHKQRGKMKKINSAKVVKQWSENKPRNHPGDPESNAPFDFKTRIQLPNIYNNTEEEKRSGSEDLTVSSAPNVLVKPTAFADIKDSTEEETESGFMDLPIPSAPNAPVEISSSTRAAAAVLEMKAPAIIVSRAKVTEEPWMVTGWLPQNDNIQPSAEEREADLKFEHLYNIIRHHGGSPPPSPSNQRQPVFKNIYN